MSKYICICKKMVLPLHQKGYNILSIGLCFRGCPYTCRMMPHPSKGFPL